MQWWWWIGIVWPQDSPWPGGGDGGGLDNDHIVYFD